MRLSLLGLLWVSANNGAHVHADERTDVEQMGPANGAGAITSPRDDFFRDPYIDQPSTPDSGRKRAVYGDQDTLRAEDFRRTDDGGAKASGKRRDQDEQAAEDSMTVPLTTEGAARGSPDSLARDLGRSRNARQQSNAAERSGIDEVTDLPGIEIAPGTRLRVIIPETRGAPATTVETPPATASPR
jgi:hypothetical protein